MRGKGVGATRPGSRTLDVVAFTYLVFISMDGQSNEWDGMPRTGAQRSWARRIAEVRLTPVLISDPPLLNVQGVHQPYTPGWWSRLSPPTG